MNKIRLGIVGAGIMGRRVAEAAVRTLRFEVAAVADSDLDRANSLAAEFGASSYASVRALCAAGEVDAVYVALPHHLHLEACLAAAEADLHVLVDKPLCNTVEEADQIGDVAAASTKVWMVGFSYRFRAEWQRAEALVTAGEIGVPYFVSDTAFEAYRSTPSWYWDVASGGGTLQLQSHHSFDRLAWLLKSTPAQIACRVVRSPSTAEISAQISAAYESGVVAGISLSFGLAYDAAPRTLFVLQADRGMLQIDDQRTLRITTADGTTVENHADDDWLSREIWAFASAIAGDEPGYPGIAEGREALQCALTAGRAASAAGWVSLHD